jgi:cysteine desulfurase
MKSFLEKVKEIDHVYINGDLNNKVPNILNVSFNFVEGESLIMGLERYCSVVRICMYICKS